MRILLADDNAGFRHMVKAILAKRGYEVIAFWNGEEALAALEQPRSPSLAILDVNMPGMTGLEVCKRFRQSNQGAPTYIILLTANDSKSDLVAGLEGGADDYITKPFDSEELCARVSVGARIVELQRNLAEHVQELKETSAELKRNEEKVLRRSRQAALGADIGVALAQNDSLRRILQKATESMVRHLNVAFARIWTLNGEGDILELQASAGMYTHLDGNHACVPVGKLKIGRIAAERKPHLTNDVFTDPWVGDLAWAKAEGLVSFAGYPLIVEGRLVGVLAMFSREALEQDTLETLASVANIIAQGIERKKAEEALRLSEEKYRSLIANIPDVTWTSDIKGHTTFISPNVERVTGFSADEIINNPDRWFGIIHPDDQPAVVEAYGSLYRNNTNFDVNYRVKRKDGEWVWLHNRAVATYEKDGTMFADGVFTDITERRAVEEALRQSEENLRRAQKLEAIGQLAAGIAHEINTPMQYLGDNIRFFQDSFEDLARAMSIYEKLLNACKDSDPEAELIAEVEAAVKAADVEYLVGEIPNALRQSLEGVERVTNIVRSMKDFAHPGAGKKPADLNKAIESTITVARNEWKYVADLVTDFDPNLPLVPCMLGEFNQVILNMIVNAAHAISDVVGDGSRGKGLIKVGTRQNGGMAEICITDTGVGIPEKIRNRIFDPFFTTKDVGRGTGQGLAISHTVIVEKHGGAIEFDTRLGHGTTFTIRLPIKDNQAAMPLKKEL